MAATVKKQPSAAPTRRFAELIAATLVAAYLVACLVLYIDAGDGRWDHRIKLFEALGPLVGLAVGWVFGKEVHRQAAADAKLDADRGHQLAGAVRQALVDYRRTTGPTGDTAAAGAVVDPASSHLEALAVLADELFGAGARTAPPASA